MSEIVLKCQDLRHWYGPKLVLHNVNIQIARGQIVGLVGPSGCGKSTLLRAILGTHPPSDGKVVVYKPGDEAGEIVTSPGRDRGDRVSAICAVPLFDDPRKRGDWTKAGRNVDAWADRWCL